MKRWNGSDMIESAEIDAFVDAIHEVYKKHGYCIEHEDYQGSFLISDYAGPEGRHGPTMPSKRDSAGSLMQARSTKRRCGRWPL